MLDDSENPDQSPRIALDEINFGLLDMPSGVSRLHSHFQGDEAAITAAGDAMGALLDPKAALKLGLVTFTPDDLDWEDEIRLALEERASLSPDALTGMEASLRFPGAESMETKIFGRLSAWQNWVFIRPNSTGEHGALKLFGSGSKAKFSWERV